MADEIKDGTGNAYRAKVDDKHRLHTRATTRNEIHEVSETEEEAFIWTIVTFDPGAGDTIFGLKNENSDKNLHITQIRLHSDVECQAILHRETGVTMAGTEVGAKNLNLHSGVTAEADARADETGNTLDAAKVLLRDRVYANTRWKIDFEGALIINNGEGIFIDLVEDVGEVQCTVMGYYHD